VPSNQAPAIQTIGAGRNVHAKLARRASIRRP
jgi:hypothetical protein